MFPSHDRGGEGALLNAQNVYNAIQDWQDTLGLDTRDKYFSNPEEFVPPPPPEDTTSEALEIAEAEVTLKANQAAADHELDVQKHIDDTAIKQTELRLKAEELAIKRAELLTKAESAQQERELKALFKIADMQGGNDNVIPQEGVRGESSPSS